MSRRGLTVEGWAFCSLGGSDPMAWLADRDQRDATAPVASDLIPPMLRRRMSRLSKIAVQAALKVCPRGDVDYLVFCSRDGELNRTSTLLACIAAGTELSPADFSQSVHNTTSGLYSIITKSRSPACSLTAGTASFAYAWLEVEAFLAEHDGSRVLLVDSDDVLPEEYRTFGDRQGCPYAVALLLSAGDDSGVGMRSEAGGEGSALPIGPQFLAWWLSGDQSLELSAEDRLFVWERRLGS